MYPSAKLVGLEFVKGIFQTSVSLNRQITDHTVYRSTNYRHMMRKGAAEEKKGKKGEKKSVLLLFRSVLRSETPFPPWEREKKGGVKSS